MKKFLALLSIFLALPVSAATVYQDRTQPHPNLETFTLPSCTAGDARIITTSDIDSDRNTDSLEAILNNASLNTFCFQAGDYTREPVIDITQSGTSGTKKVIRYYDPTNPNEVTHPASRSSDAILWRIKFPSTVSHWIVHGMTFDYEPHKLFIQDPYAITVHGDDILIDYNEVYNGLPDGITIGFCSDDPSESCVEDTDCTGHQVSPNDVNTAWCAGGVDVATGSIIVGDDNGNFDCDNITIQRNYIYDTAKYQGGDSLGIGLSMSDYQVNTMDNIKVLDNEIANAGDGFQIIANTGNTFADSDTLPSKVSGIIENNHIYITSKWWARCDFESGTHGFDGLRTGNGSDPQDYFCSCVENGVDNKVGGTVENPLVVKNNLLTGFRPTTDRNSDGDNGGDTCGGSGSVGAAITQSSVMPNHTLYAGNIIWDSSDGFSSANKSTTTTYQDNILVDPHPLPNGIRRSLALNGASEKFYRNVIRSDDDVTRLQFNVQANKEGKPVDIAGNVFLGVDDNSGDEGALVKSDYNWYYGTSEGSISSISTPNSSDESNDETRTTLTAANMDDLCFLWKHWSAPEIKCLSGVLTSTTSPHYRQDLNAGIGSDIYTGHNAPDSIAGDYPILQSEFSGDKSYSVEAGNQICLTAEGSDDGFPVPPGTLHYSWTENCVQTLSYDDALSEDPCFTPTTAETCTLTLQVCDEGPVANCEAGDIHGDTASLEVTSTLTAKLNVTGGCNCANSQTASGGNYCTASSITYTIANTGETFTVNLGDPDGAGAEDNVYECGQYANGDVWVMGKSDGSSGTVVRVESTTPAWDLTVNQGCTDCAEGRHGWDVDPSGIGDANQNFDGRQAKSASFVAPTTAHPIPANFSVTSGYRSFMKSVGGNTVNAESNTNGWFVCWNGNIGGCIDFQGVITFVQCKTGCTYLVDTDGDGQTGDEMRPSFFGAPADKITGVNVADFTLTGLGSLDNTQISTSIKNGWTFANIRDYYRWPRYDAFSNSTSFHWQYLGQQHDSNIEPGGCTGCSRWNYGLEMASVNATSVMRMLLNDWSLGSPGDDSYQALVNFAQVALDYVAIMDNSSMEWGNQPSVQGNGNQHGGRKMLLSFINTLLETDATHGATIQTLLDADRTWADKVYFTGSNGIEYIGATHGSCVNAITLASGGSPDNYSCAHYEGTNDPAEMDPHCQNGTPSPKTSGSTSYAQRNGNIMGYNAIVARNWSGFSTSWNDSGYENLGAEWRTGGRDTGHTGGAWCSPDGSGNSPTYTACQNDPEGCGESDNRETDLGEAMITAFGF